MPVDTQYPVDIGRDTAGDILESAGEVRQLFLAAFCEAVGSRGKQDFGLEYESVADDLDIAAVAEHLPQTAEKLRAIAG